MNLCWTNPATLSSRVGFAQPRLAIPGERNKSTVNAAAARLTSLIEKPPCDNEDYHQFRFTGGSGLDPADPLVELLVRWMGIARRGERARMASEALGEVEVPGRAVDVRDRRVAEGMEGIDRLESRCCLPLPKHELDPSERDPTL